MVQTGAHAVKKILYIFDASDWESRFAVAEAANAKGHNVILGLINATDRKTDFKTVKIGNNARKIGIFSSLSMVKDINRAIKAENPDIIHTITLKYSFLTGIAAHNHKNKRKIFTLAGLGYIFRDESKKSKIVRRVLSPLLKHILKRKNTTLIFQNQDDLELLVKRKYATKEKSILIKGSGVYLNRFKPEEKPEQNSEYGCGQPIVLMPTRLVKEKGVSIFIDAAKILKEQGVMAKFQIAGGTTTHNPRAISETEMSEMLENSDVEWLGRVSDMPQILNKAAFIVYPSYYGEGIPRVLLEACAAGRAIITTDHPGCREAVDHGKNGLLVPVKDANATAEAIKTLLNDKDLRKKMEKAAREKAVTEFNIHDIVAQTISVYSSNV